MSIIGGKVVKILILAGGSGNRLWPLSTEKYPKQFLKLMNSDISLIQDVFLWASKMVDIKDIFIITNVKYKQMVIQQIKEVQEDYQVENILIEPLKKNTLPSIYYGVLSACKEEDTVLILPSDQKNSNQDQWSEKIKETQKLAEEYIVTFGICPTKPHTQYGYICPGESKYNGFTVKEFKEKPDATLAQEYLEKGYLWNSGMFLFNSSLFIEEVKKYSPQIYDAFQNLSDFSKGFEKVTEGISIDYGLMEKTKKAAVVPINLGWNDMGNFDSFYDVFEKDKDGNILSNNENMIESTGNLVISKNNKNIVLIGVDDMIVVESDDALLLCKKSYSHKVNGESINEVDLNEQNTNAN